MTGEPKLLPHEEQKLRELLRRSDALGNAWEAVWEGEDWGSAEHKAQTLWTLGELSAEADERFRSYRRELGIPGRPSRKPA